MLHLGHSRISKAISSSQPHAKRSKQSTYFDFKSSPVMDSYVNANVSLKGTLGASWYKCNTSHYYITGWCRVLSCRAGAWFYPLPHSTLSGDSNGPTTSKFYQPIVVQEEVLSIQD